MSDDDEIESFIIEDELCQQITNTPQDDSGAYRKTQIANRIFTQPFLC